MELSDYLRVLRKFWVSITALAMLGVAAAALLSLLTTPTYTSSTSLFVTVQNANSAGELASGSTYAERQVKSFAEVAETPIVLQPVIDRLRLDTTPGALAGKVNVSVPTNTSVLEVAVEDTDPARAAATASGIAESLVGVVGEIAPKDAKGESTVQVTVVKPAAIPTSWTSPKVAQNLTLGLLVGLMLGVGQALLRHVLDTKVRNAEDIAHLTDVPVVGTVAFDEDAPGHELAVVDAPNSLRAEDFRRLRTNMQFLGAGGGGRSFAFTSSLPDEGKTSTTMNVAFSLAATGRRVLLVDADLRRPSVAKRLGLEDAVGLTTILIGRATLDDVVQPLAGGVDVLASGQVPPNPSELLGSEAMRGLVIQASTRYDYVLFDTAPLVPVVDTAALSRLIGGVIVVVGSGDVHAAQLEESLASVEAAEGNVLGVVLNKLRAEDAGHRKAVYYQREGYGETPAASAPTAPERARAARRRPAARAL